MRTRLVSAFVASLFAVPLTLAACGGDGGEEAFDTLQACFDDHHEGDEGLPTTEAITVCCVDHPIAGVHPSCGATEADCVTHVSAELDDTISAADIQTACTDYVAKK